MVVSPIKIFLGSSSEKRAIAEDLERRLSPFLLVEPWWNLPEGDTIIGALLHKAAECDMAVFVLSPDDFALRSSRRKRLSIARDNVIYELGLFAGAVDPTNSLMLVDENDPINLPSDLQGVIQLRWRSDASDSIDNAVKKIRTAAERYSERRGLGWWIVKSINLSVRPRAFYGVFEVIRSAVIANAHRHDLDVWAYLRDILKRLAKGGTDPAQLSPDVCNVTPRNMYARSVKRNGSFLPRTAAIRPRSAASKR
jgi:hypothetical protein